MKKRFITGCGTVPLGIAKPLRLAPGVQLYASWNDIPRSSGLQTKTQWAKEGKKLKPGAREKGVVKGDHGVFKLYDREAVEGN